MNNTSDTVWLTVLSVIGTFLISFGVLMFGFTLGELSGKKTAIDTIQREAVAHKRGTWYIPKDTEMKPIFLWNDEIEDGRMK